MHYLDSHCHLNDEAFKEDVDLAVKQAKENNVLALLIIGYDLESSKKAIDIANQYEGVYAAVGIHPENFEGLDFSALEQIKEMAKDPKVIAIGEIGLDYHWYKEEEHRAKQKEWLIRQIDLFLRTARFNTCARMREGHVFFIKRTSYQKWGGSPLLFRIERNASRIREARSLFWI